MRKYLATLDEAAWGAASEVTPKFVFRSDPAAQRTGALKDHVIFAYATNYLIDLDHAAIVDVEASRAIRQADVGSARTMIARTHDRVGLWPARLAADSAYGSADNLAWLVDRLCGVALLGHQRIILSNCDRREHRDHSDQSATHAVPISSYRTRLRTN